MRVIAFSAASISKIIHRPSIITWRGGYYGGCVRIIRSNEATNGARTYIPDCCCRLKHINGIIKLQLIGWLSCSVFSTRAIIYTRLTIILWLLLIFSEMQSIDLQRSLSKFTTCIWEDIWMNEYSDIYNEIFNEMIWWIEWIYYEMLVKITITCRIKFAR